MIDIDFEKEQPLTLPKVAARYRVARSTVYGWVKHGYCGIFLDAVRRGHKYMTTVEACERFFEAIELGEREAVSRTEDQQAADSEEAARRLEAMGV